MHTLVLKRSFAFVAAIFTATLLMQLALITPAHSVADPARAWVSGSVWDGGGGDMNFSTAANWEGDTLPVSGEAISLNTEGMTDGTFNVDLDTEGSNVSAFDYIRLGGDGSGTFTLTGDALVLDSGIDNDGDLYNYQTFVVENDVTLAGNSDFRAGGKLIIGATDGTGTLDLATFTMTKKGEYPLKIYSTTEGSGGVTVSNGDYVAEKDTTVALVIESGGTLMGNNVTVGDVTVNSGGALAPGLSPGCITTGDLVLAGTFEVEIDGATVCTEYDQTTVTGAVDVTGATLDVQKLASYDPTSGGAVFIIIDNDTDTDPVTGTFTGLAEGETATFDGVEYVVSYVGGDGNDVTLTVADVPEAPDTGFGLHSVNYILVLALTAFAAIGLVFTARKLNKINV